MYPVYNAHAAILSFVDCPTVQSFSTYLINGTILEKKTVIEHKTCVLIFSTIFVRKIFHSKKNWARNDEKYILVLM